MMPELTKNPMPVGAISHKGYRITDEEAQGIVRAYHQGKTVPEIMTMFSVSDTSVNRILEKNGISVPKARRMWTEKEMQECERLFNLGWSSLRIAQQLGRTEGSVSGWISGRLRGRKPSYKYRLDGTPIPETQTKPDLADQIEEAKAKMLDENGFEVIEKHTKTIRTKNGTYGINLVTDCLTLSLDKLPGSGEFTKEEFGALIDEMAKIYALM